MVLFPLTALALAQCAAPEPAVSISLADRFSMATVEGRASVPRATRRDWDFADPTAGAWHVASAVDDLRVAGGELRGRTTGEQGLIFAERSGPRGKDIVHSVAIRIRVSNGASLSVNFKKSPGPPSGAPSSYSVGRTPLVPGDEARTYHLILERPVAFEDARQMLLSPSDASGAEFGVEWIRLISRREYLASVPPGTGWHGLGGIYRETIVTRAPEQFGMTLRLPERARLDLALGTLGDAPVTFDITVRDASAVKQLLRYTAPQPDEWQSVRIDLSPYSNGEVELVFGLESNREGAIGFWGSPVVRSLRMTVPDEGASGVLLIVADALRADRLQPYGSLRATSPHIAQLASQGAVFERCISQATWTKPSMTSIMTSLYPPTHRVIDFTDRVSSSARTLAEEFRGAGWATLGLSSITFNGEFGNLHRGYEVFHESRSLPNGLNLKTARVQVDRLLPWLEEHRDVPFFVMIHVADPHSPFEPYPPYDKLWSQPGARADHGAALAKVLPAIQDPIMRRFGMPNRVELESVGLDPAAYTDRELGWYDASIRGMDTEIGRILQHLDRLGLTETTLVALTSDHGEEFLEHGRHLHGHGVYEELSHVPLILRGPRIVPGTRVRNTVQSIDLMPTLLELARLTPSDGFQGQSLVPLIDGHNESAWVERPAFTVALDPYERPKSTRGEDRELQYPAESYSVREGGWMLVYNDRRPSSWPEYELYDERDDPQHENDLALDHPDVVARLAGTLEAWKAKAESTSLENQPAVELKGAELEQLRALGYLN